jgi:Ni,Fe-hydrogenase maturation factor
LSAVLELGKRAGCHVPSAVVVYTMEAADISDFGEGLTPEVQAAIPTMVRRIMLEQFP